MKGVFSVVLVACGTLAAQTPQAVTENQKRMAAGQTPVFRTTVVERSAKAINYRHRSGATKIDFKGTALLPASHGEAKVESKQGYIEIEVEFDNLQPANKQGAEYLTYVLWAITPEGRTSNLGEILLNGTRSKLNVTTELQVFGLLVTAEPYYSVSRPSDLIVMENVVRKDTIGKIEEIDAKYELLQRGQYQRLANPLALRLDRKTPLELYEARNAVQIARAIGADRFAAETFQKAEKSLAEAEAYQLRNAGRKPVTMTARAAVQTAEDARAIAVKRQEDDLLAAERQQSIEREARAESGRVAAQSETDRVTRDAEVAHVRAQAETERLTREKNAVAAAALAEADRLKNVNEAQSAAARVEADRLKLENETRASAATAEVERLKLANEASAKTAAAELDRLRTESAATKVESDRAKLENVASASAAAAEVERLKLANEASAKAAAAELDRLRVESAAAKANADRATLESEARAMAALATADRLKRASDAQLAAGQVALDNAAKQKAQLEAEQAGLRKQLMQQFNAILQTRDTARGLIVNMSDVLFDTGKFALRPQAREKMAKVAGIVSGHPGLRLEVEGHTDSVGGEAFNQELSEHRGNAVRDYLVEQGMAASSVTSKGFGETKPVASNDTAQGRQQNRRVELVISGDVIGSAIGSTVASR